jgi:hypothetical protein
MVTLAACRGDHKLAGPERFQAKHALGLDPGVGTGSREENATKQKRRAQLRPTRQIVLIRRLALAAAMAQ